MYLKGGTPTLTPGNHILSHDSGLLTDVKYLPMFPRGHYAPYQQSTTMGSYVIHSGNDTRYPDWGVTRVTGFTPTENRNQVNSGLRVFD